jgi:HPt (histidine-containing phosphotransfer) domain-containing protein
VWLKKQRNVLRLDHLKDSSRNSGSERLSTLGHSLKHSLSQNEPDVHDICFFSSLVDPRKTMSDVKDNPVPVLNFALVMEQTMNDEELLDDLLKEALLDEAPKTIELLDALERGANNEMQGVGSYINGYAANLGIEGLAQATQTFKSICREIRDGNKSQKKIEESAQSLQTVFHELWRFRRFIERRFASADS